MAKDGEGGSFGIPWPALLTLFLAGSAAIYYSSLKSERPQTPPSGNYPALGVQQYPSRLWQDPFKASNAWTSEASKQGASSVWERSFWLGERQQQKLPGLAEQIKEMTKPGQGPLVLAVIVSAGPSAELAEQRQRVRVGVLEGLFRSGYEAVDSNHLGLEILRWRADQTSATQPIQPSFSRSVCRSDDARGQNLAPFPVPYEWFRVTNIPVKPLSSIGSSPHNTGLTTPGEQDALVVWLPEELMTDRPLTRMSDALTAIGAFSEAGKEAQSRICVLGPRVSPTLRTLVHEAVARLPEGNRPSESLSTVTILSPTALAADDNLRDFSVTGYWDNHLLKKERMQESIPELVKKTVGAKFIRTTTTDADICQTLWDELGRRHLAGAGRNGHIVVVGESDTFYGRALTQTFISKRTDADQNQIECYSYLRGVDGMTGEPDAANAPESKSNDESTGHSPTGAAKLKGADESPNGTNQSDYLRRLADQIVQCDRKLKREGNRDGVVAVGVFGTDVYDKLLILRALRDRLSEPLYFTTNVDAQYTLSSEWDAAHNLVCVSSFGLSLHPDYQQPFSPFRDSYETADYAATLMAVHPDLANNLPKTLGDPRIFEVGRGGLVDLSVDKSVARPSLQPERSDVQDPKGDSRLRWKLGVAAVVIAILALALYCGVRPLDARTGLLKPWLMFIITPVAAYSLAVFYPKYAYDAEGEIFAWVSGVSIWPTELIRISAGGIAAFFIWRSWVEGDDNERQIEDRFRLCTLKNAPLEDQSASLSAKANISSAVPQIASAAPVQATVCTPANQLSPQSRAHRTSEKEFTTQDSKPARIHKNDPDIDVAAYMPLQSSSKGWSFSLKYWRVLGTQCTPEGPNASPALPPDPLRDGQAGHFLGRAGYDLKPDVHIYAQNLWWEYLRRSRGKIRACRVAGLWFLLVVLYLLLHDGLFSCPRPPARGNYAFIVDFLALNLSVFGGAALTALVLDSTYLNRRFIQCLACTDTYWPAETVRAFNFNCSRETISEYLDIRLIAMRTRVVGEVIYYPFVIFFLLVVARSSLFANWTWPIGLIVVLAIDLGLAVIAALMLRMTAEKARTIALKKIEVRRIKALCDNDRDQSDLLDKFADAIREEREGAFSILSSHPLIAAILLPSGSVGAWAILEYIARFAS